ncbi:MAG: ABC transporter ATP-binding protein [Lapillicoccus sp.]
MVDEQPAGPAPANPGAPAIELIGVAKQFAADDGNVQAVEQVDLAIETGEFFSLLGPSGCGKTTTLRMIAGFEEPTAGQVLLYGENMVGVPPNKRDMNMVFQSYALFPHMSVRGNIAFGLQMRRLPKSDVKRRTDEAIRLVQLEEHAGKLPGQLSGGQQQRVAIARAVVLEPSLVLMDEPLSNLDAKLRLEMRTEIRRLHQSLGLTTVYVTHDQEEALSMADRLVVLRQGQVQQIGTPEDLHTRPANWHVADFMGFRNLLQVTVSAVDKDGVLVEGHGLKLRASPMGEVGSGDSVAAGVRPEDLVIGAQPSDGPNVIRATVEVVEYQGREMAVEVRTAEGLRLHVRSEERLAPGAGVTLSVAPERLLVFPLDDEPLPSVQLALGDALPSRNEPVLTSQGAS